MSQCEVRHTLHCDISAFPDVQAQVCHSAKYVALRTVTNQHALLCLLRPLQLPECLRIIGYLRRLGVFSKQGLRLQVCRQGAAGTPPLSRERKDVAQAQLVLYHTPLHYSLLKRSTGQYSKRQYNTMHCNAMQDIIRWIEHRTAYQLPQGSRFRDPCCCWALALLAACCSVSRVSHVFQALKFLKFSSFSSSQVSRLLSAGCVLRSFSSAGRPGWRRCYPSSTRPPPTNT